MIPNGADSKSYPFKAALAVPLKPFNRAKTRLADILDQTTRSRLAQALAIKVLNSSPNLVPYVVCESLPIREWASGLGYRTLFNPGMSLNASLEISVGRLQLLGFTHVVVAHSDLPFAGDLSFLTLSNQIMIAPDRHLIGTNAISMPVLPAQTSRFSFHFGRHSFAAHVQEAFTLAHAPMIVDNPGLALDLDDSADLELARSLGFDHHKLLTQLDIAMTSRRRNSLD